MDALEYLESDFRALDDEFKKRRRNGRFKATEVRIIAGEVIAGAKRRADRVRHLREDVERTGGDSGRACACSVADRDEAGAGAQGYCLVRTRVLSLVHTLTFKDRSNMTPSQRSIMTRDTVVMALMGLLLFFW